MEQIIKAKFYKELDEMKKNPKYTSSYINDSIRSNIRDRVQVFQKMFKSYCESYYGFLEKRQSVKEFVIPTGYEYVSLPQLEISKAHLQLKVAELNDLKNQVEIAYYEVKVRSDFFFLDCPIKSFTLPNVDMI